jgi:hypothetical protein
MSGWRGERASREKKVVDVDNTRWITKAIVTASSLLLAAFGTLMLFAPGEVSAALTPSAGSNVIVQVCAAAVLGFAAMNWTARWSALGGIYGRAVVVGNQTHLMIGALLLVSAGADVPRSAAYWVLAGLYICGAAIFSYLLFFSSGLSKPSRG